MSRAPRYRMAGFLVRASSAGTAVLATRPSPLCHLHSPQAKWVYRTLWSRRYAIAMLERTESRVPLIPHAWHTFNECYLLLSTWMSRKLPEACRKLSCREHPLLGSPSSQQTALEKSKVSVNLFAACRKRDWAWYCACCLWWGLFGFWKGVCCDISHAGSLEDLAPTRCLL